MDKALDNAALGQSPRRKRQTNKRQTNDKTYANRQIDSKGNPKRHAV
jgi:hypothetical protein